MFGKRNQVIVQPVDPIVDRVRRRGARLSGDRGEMSFGGQYALGGMMLVFVWFALYVAVIVLGTIFFHEV